MGESSEEDKEEDDVDDESSFPFLSLLDSLVAEFSSEVLLLVSGALFFTITVLPLLLCSCLPLDVLVGNVLIFNSRYSLLYKKAALLEMLGDSF